MLPFSPLSLGGVIAIVSFMISCEMMKTTNEEEAYESPYIG
jgi:hypothetical protein